MTKTQARKILGISSSAGLKPAERVYRDKCQRAQRRMMPGNAIVDRKKAQDRLVELTAAWRALNTKPVKRKRQPAAKRTVNRKKPTRQTAAPNLPEDLANAWDDLFSALPFSEPVVVIILIIVSLLGFISLFSSL